MSVQYCSSNLMREELQCGDSRLTPWVTTCRPRTYNGNSLVVQDDAKQATVDGEPAVVVDEAELLELVHEVTDA